MSVENTAPLSIELLKLNKDIKAASKLLTRQQARYLVDLFYTIQDYRIRTTNQTRKLGIPEDSEPDIVISHFATNFDILEHEMKLILRNYVKSQDIGQWLMSITGIGEILAAGLIAHIDITKVESAGQIQAFGGYDPNQKWEKGQTIPWNSTLKTLYWKCGDSFVKQKNRESDVYGHLYQQRKDYENEKNINLEYREQAVEKLQKFKIGKETDAYKYYSQGMLPPAHIDSRARRWAVKLFISHLFDCWYELDRHEKPPKPYAIEHLGHVHKIPVPNYEIIETLIAKHNNR